MSFKELEDGHMAAILDIKTQHFYQFLIFMSPQYLPPSFSSIGLIVWDQKWFEIFKMTAMKAILDIGIQQF